MKYSKNYAIYAIIILSLGVIVSVLLTIDFPDRAIFIYSDEDFDRYKFPGSGDIDDPFLIENLRMVQKKNNGHIDYGILIFNTTKHFIIRNCEITDFEGGIYLRSLAKGTAVIENNKIIDCTFVGGMSCSNSESLIIRNNLVEHSDISISIYECDYSIIANNTCYNNRVGTYVTGSHHVTVTGNNCTKNAWGHVNLASNYTQIYKNSYSKNSHSWWDEVDRWSRGEGFSIMTCYFIECYNNTFAENPETGIEIYRLYNSTVAFNNCSFNYRAPGYGHGIELLDSEYNEFKYNLFSNNGEYGIKLDNSSYNIFHHNAFVDNGYSVNDSVYSENSIDNIWFDTLTSEGNYYKGWNTSTPFTIQGSLEKDLFPLEENPIELELYVTAQEFRYLRD